MNTTLFEQKIKALHNYKNLNPELINSFSGIIKKIDNWDLRRINPLKFAQKYNFNQHDIVDIFVHSARVGLFDFSWSMICPTCGEIQNYSESPDGIAGEKFHCVICNLDVPIVIDDYVEVTFNINPSIKELQLNPFANSDDYRRYFFTDSFERSSYVVNYINSIWKGFEIFEAGKVHNFTLNVERGKSYRFAIAGIHSQFVFNISDNASDSSENIEIVFDENGFYENKPTYNSTTLNFKVKNVRNETAGAIIVESDFPTLHDYIKKYPPIRQPFLTGKMLLNNQSFRELFKIQNLSSNLKLNIRSLTILFTDLKGSTELYDKTGDVTAYNLIQKHYKVLSEIVNQNSGAIIKTMGDAIMATFSEPKDGVKSAVDMMSEIRKIQIENKSLELKIGLHEGPALAINNDGRLDYFGQTVNIAARVQGLAKAGEIWMTDSIYSFPRIKDILLEQNYTQKKYNASLKGIGQPTPVYKCINMDSNKQQKGFFNRIFRTS